jgi:hypothetical protein
MTLATDEFIRRFLIHVLPKKLHRICHYGLLPKARTTSPTRASCSPLQNLKASRPLPLPIPEQLSSSYDPNLPVRNITAVWCRPKA